MKKIKLTKLTDDEFNGNHPNGINVGYTRVGKEFKPPTIGERYCIDSIYGFSTSPVLEIRENNIIKTTYSTYKIEYLET